MCHHALKPASSFLESKYGFFIWNFTKWNFNLEFLFEILKNGISKNGIFIWNKFTRFFTLDFLNWNFKKWIFYLELIYQIFYAGFLNWNFKKWIFLFGINLPDFLRWIFKLEKVNDWRRGQFRGGARLDESTKN
jgi:hypothetical protein